MDQIEELSGGHEQINMKQPDLSVPIKVRKILDTTIESGGDDEEYKWECN
jgi:hypothetical protein